MADDDSRAGRRYDDEALRAYLDGVHGPHDDALDHAFRAPAENDLPTIMVSRGEGRTLEILLRMIRAARVVEIGTLAGYSAIRMARALPEDGRLWSIEYEARTAAIARASIERAGLSAQVQILEGAALDVLPTLESHGPFDAVFVDADKQNYDRYGAWAAANLRSGGLLIGDNAYFFGKLLEESDGARAMRRFHESAAEHFYSACVPTPDGMLIGIKK